ncbi:MAG: hypothetical protein ACJAVS_001371 [Paracoccaceae bacterium]|jgi:hypothetical protein
MATLFGVSLGDNDTCAVQAAGGALVNGPFGTVTSVYGGDAFRQATVTGISTALITQPGADNGVILGEISYDAGKALFGGMTTTNYHGPSPDADALRRNILAYAAAGITASDVPLPAIAPLLLVGIAGVAAPDPGRLRDTLKKKGGRSGALRRSWCEVRSGSPGLRSFGTVTPPEYIHGGLAAELAIKHRAAEFSYRRRFVRLAENTIDISDNADDQGHAANHDRQPEHILHYKC